MQAEIEPKLVVIYHTMKNNNYQTPRVLQSISLLGECDLLQASLVDTATVKSVGQEVDEHDFTSSDLNHQWEE